MSRFNFEEMLAHSRESDRLYAESLRDEKLQHWTWGAAMALNILAVVLIVVGQRWAVWLAPAPLAWVFFEGWYLAPRRNKRLRWYSANNWMGGDTPPAERQEE